MTITFTGLMSYRHRGRHRGRPLAYRGLHRFRRWPTWPVTPPWASRFVLILAAGGGAAAGAVLLSLLVPSLAPLGLLAMLGAGRALTP